MSELSRNIRLPKKSWDYKITKFYVGEDPDPAWRHAPVFAHETFRDMKFAVRIHWGLYSIWELQRESWPFLDLPFAKRQEYQKLYKTWTPNGFDAEEWMQFFKRAGFQCFAFTTKHHEGFSMFDTKTRVRRCVNWIAMGGPKIEDCDLAYSIMETPFKRDVVKELCDAARRHSIKIDLYFSHPDWYDADFRPYSFHPLVSWKSIFHPFRYATFPIDLKHKRLKVPHPTREEVERMMLRHRAQLLELMSNYGKIDYCCLDTTLGPDCWPYLRETLQKIREIQPEVMLRNRGIGNYGDYYTPEGVVPGDPGLTNMPWMVIYPLGRTFSYEPEANNHKGTQWVIHNLIDIVAKGGNFMVGIGPNGNGKFHPEAIRQLEAAGEWLRVNGEGIYDTRMWTSWKEGDFIRYTASKDMRTVYLFTLKWPGHMLRSNIMKPKPNSDIFMLGVEQPLAYHVTETSELQVDIPEKLGEQKPCEYAWGFKFSL